MGPPITDRTSAAANRRYWLAVNKDVNRVLVSDTRIGGLKSIDRKSINATCGRSKRTLNRREIACRNTGSAVGVSNYKTVILRCNREIAQRQVGNRGIRTGIRIERRVIDNDIAVRPRPESVRCRNSQRLTAAIRI